MDIGHQSTKAPAQVKANFRCEFQKLHFNTKKVVWTEGNGRQPVAVLARLAHFKNISKTVLLKGCEAIVNPVFVAMPDICAPVSVPNFDRFVSTEAFVLFKLFLM